MLLHVNRSMHTHCLMRTSFLWPKYPKIMVQSRSHNRYSIRPVMPPYLGTWTLLLIPTWADGGWVETPPRNGLCFGNGAEVKSRICLARRGGVVTEETFNYVGILNMICGIFMEYDLNYIQIHDMVYIRYIEPYSAELCDSQQVQIEKKPRSQVPMLLLHRACKLTPYTLFLGSQLYGYKVKSPKLG